MKTICPYCKYKATNHETIAGEKDHQDGDISFCINCGEVGTFKEREIVKVDVLTLDPDTRKQIYKMEHAWLQTRSQMKFRK